MKNFTLFVFLLFFSLKISATTSVPAAPAPVIIDPTDSRIACGGVPCKIPGVKPCPVLEAYNKDQDIYRNYVIDGVIWAKDHRYYAKGDTGALGNQEDNTFYPTEEGIYAILYSNKIHDTGLVIDLKADGNDDLNVDKIQFHSFAAAGPQLPYATADDHILLTQAKMSRGFLSFNLFTKYVDGVTKRITGVQKMNSDKDGVEFCLRGFGMVKYNHNHDSTLHGSPGTSINSDGHWSPQTDVGGTGIAEGERDEYEFGSLDLQFVDDIVVKNIYDNPPYMDFKNWQTNDKTPEGDGIYLIIFRDSYFHLYGLTSDYDKKFHRPPDYQNWGLYYRGSAYKGKYPLLSLHSASVVKRNLKIKKESDNKVVACYCYSSEFNKREFKKITTPNTTLDCDTECGP